MSLEREIRKIMAKAVYENFVNNPDCDICGDGSPCTCGESQEVNEMNPAKHVQKNDETGMYCVYNKSGEKVKEFEDKADAVKYATDNHDKLMEKLDADDTPQIKKIVKKLKGASKAHADQAKSLEKELSDDIRNLPKDKQRALQHADKTAKPKSKVSLAPTPGIKTEISFRPNDDTSLGKRYADKVGRGDYDNKKTDNRKKGIATMVNKRAAQKGVPGTANVPFSESNLDEAFEVFFAEAKGMKVFFVSGSNAEGNVHAKNEKEALAIAKKKGIKGKITIRDKGKAVQPKFVESVNEGYEGEVKKVLDKKGIDAYFKNGKLMVSKRDKPMVMKVLKGQDFDMPKIQVEEIQMEKNRFGLSVSLVDAVANVLAGKRPVEEKKKMDPVGQEDGDIDNDGDKDDSDEYLMKKRKAIGKAMKKDAGGKEPVDTKPKMDEEKIDEKLTPAQRDMRDAGRGKDSAATQYVKKQAGSDNPHKKGRMYKGDNQSHDDQRHVRKGEDDFKKPSQDRLASQPSPAKRLDMKKKKDAFDKAKAQSQSPSGRNNMGGVGIREDEMTDAQMKRREEIVKELKKKSADFESRYGDKADAVMYATATKMAMKGK